MNKKRKKIIYIEKNGQKSLGLFVVVVNADIFYFVFLINKDEQYRMMYMNVY